MAMATTKWNTKQSYTQSTKKNFFSSINLFPQLYIFATKKRRGGYPSFLRIGIYRLGSSFVGIVPRHSHTIGYIYVYRLMNRSNMFIFG